MAQSGIGLIDESGGAASRVRSATLGDCGGAIIGKLAALRPAGSAATCRPPLPSLAAVPWCRSRAVAGLQPRSAGRSPQRQIRVTAPAQHRPQRPAADDSAAQQAIAQRSTQRPSGHVPRGLAASDYQDAQRRDGEPCSRVRPALNRGRNDDTAGPLLGAGARQPRPRGTQSPAPTPTGAHHPPQRRSAAAVAAWPPMSAKARAALPRRRPSSTPAQHVAQTSTARPHPTSHRRKSRMPYVRELGPPRRRAPGPRHPGCACPDCLLPIHSFKARIPSLPAPAQTPRSPQAFSYRQPRNSSLRLPACPEVKVKL